MLGPYIENHRLRIILSQRNVDARLRRFAKRLVVCGLDDANDLTVPIVRMTGISEQIDSSIVPQRLIAMLSAGFGALGALLAAIGLYGLLAYTVARRTHEIGVRMALGAAGTDVMRIVLRGALWMVCAGLAIGAPLAFWGKRVAASLIPDLPVASPLPIVVAAAIMIAVGLIAAYLPARRAMRVAPMVALRYE